jgi:hypothetical protein
MQLLISDFSIVPTMELPKSVLLKEWLAWRNIVARANFDHLAFFNQPGLPPGLKRIL